MKQLKATQHKKQNLLNHSMRIYFGVLLDNMVYYISLFLLSEGENIIIYAITYPSFTFMSQQVKPPIFASQKMLQKQTRVACSIIKRPLKNWYFMLIWPILHVV